MKPLNQASGNALLPDDAETLPRERDQDHPNGVPELSKQGRTPLIRDASGIGGIVVRHPLMTSPLNSFEGYMRTWRNAAKSTVDRYKSGLRFLERATGKPITTDLNGGRLTRQDVIDAVTHSTHLKPESHSAIICSAKAWEKAGNFLGWWDQTEIQEISFSVPDSDPKPPLTPQEVQRVWSCCQSSRDFRLVALGLYAGTRIGEAEKMDGDCWLEDRLRFRSSKTRRQIDVPLHPELERLRDVILNDSDLAQFALKSTSRNLRDRAGFYFTAHAFRRTFTQALIDAKVPVWVVDDLTGHRPRSTTLGAYAVVPWPDKEQAIDALSY